MLELIAVGYVLSVLTIIMKKNGGDLGLLDPFGVKMISIYMMCVLLSLLIISNIARNF